MLIIIGKIIGVIVLIGVGCVLALVLARPGSDQDR